MAQLLLALHEHLDLIDFQQAKTHLPDVPEGAEPDEDTSHVHAAREKAEQLLRMVAGDPEQDAFVREVQRRVQGGEGGAIFLTAIGGGGKTTCLNAVIHWMISTGRHAVVTASSGVAANLLELGNTFHSTTRAPVKDTWEGEVPQCFDMHNHARDLKAQNLLRADAGAA